MYMRSRFHVSLAGILFILMHLACLAVLWTGIDWKAAMLGAGMLLTRKFGITGGFHRYFSHRSYKTSRIFQFCLAFLGGAAAQKGALWWAAHHRHHHKHSDTPDDVHSAKLEGFYWSHVGWVLSDEYVEYNPDAIRDLVKYPELVWLDRWIFVPPVTFALFCFLVHGWMGLVVGFFISTVILYHTTFAINSLCHMFGSRRYETGEESRNNLWLAILTLGEGWHNNHHHYPLSCRQGFFWWEIDITYYILLGLEKIGLVWDLKVPPAHILREANAPVLAGLAKPPVKVPNLNGRPDKEKKHVEGFYVVEFDYPDQGAPYALSGTAMVTLNDGIIKGYSSELIFDGSFDESSAEVLEMNVLIRPRSSRVGQEAIAALNLRGKGAATDFVLTAPFPDYSPDGGVARARFQRKGANPVTSPGLRSTHALWTE
jgi:stearoyl-CoA desaturase (delta-9 desaturase)